jgi:hypothetical protein
LIDELPEEDLPAAERVLQTLRATGAPLVPLDKAPLDDEPDDDDFDGGLTEARADVEAGRVVPHEEVKRRWDLLLTAKLYELGRLSSGQAARLCGKARVDFLLSLPRIGVSISNLRPEDAEAEVRFLQRA